MCKGIETGNHAEACKQYRTEQVKPWKDEQEAMTRWYPLLCILSLKSEKLSRIPLFVSSSYNFSLFTIPRL